MLSSRQVGLRPKEFYRIVVSVNRHVRSMQIVAEFGDGVENRKRFLFVHGVTSGNVLSIDAGDDIR